MATGLQSTISDVLRTEFANTVYELTQQTSARLRGVVEIEQITSEEKMFPRIGNVEVQQLNERFAEITPADILWDNRRLSATRVGVPLFVDEWDAERMLADPKSILAKRAAQALERNLDRVIIGAATATVYTGRQGTVPLTAASDGVVTVDATQGFVYETLLQIDANFQAYEVGTDMPVRKYLLVSEQEHQAMMKEAELISGDFSRQYVVEKGEITRVLDMEVIKFGSKVPIPMLPVTNGVRQCLAIAMGGIKVGITRNWDIKVKDRNDRWDTIQVLASGIVGGTRMEGVRVQIVNTTAT